MAWRIEYTPKSAKALSKLDKATAARIVNFMLDRPAQSPRSLGKPLAGPFAGFWRYRVGDYRILARIEDDRLVVLVVKVGHRRGIYGGGG